MSTPEPLLWPDGEPVTPWADPWHDILGDIRALHDACSPDTWYRVLGDGDD